MPNMFTQMDAVCHRFEELSIRLNQPDTAADPALFRRLMREYHDAEPVVQAYRAWQTAQDHLAQAKALLEEPGALDPDFKQMIQQEGRKLPCLPTACCACTPCMCKAGAGSWKCSTSTRRSLAA